MLRIDDKKIEYMPKNNSWIEHAKCRLMSGSVVDKLLLLMVFLGLLLDNMLLTTVVPITPNFLLDQEIRATEANGTLSAGCTIYMKQLMLGHLKQDSILLHSGVKSSHPLLPFLDVPNSQVPQSCDNRTREKVREDFQHMLANVNRKVGVMFASKAVMQIITNPFVGILTNRIGYSVTLFTGFVIMFISTLTFAFGTSFAFLFIARAFQGVGSAFTSVSGMGLLATHFRDEESRGNAFTVALSGLAFGVLVGPPFGGILYQFANKPTPFLILAFLVLLDGLLQVRVLKIEARPENEKGTSILKLLRDPYILIAAGSLTFGNMGIALLEPSLPLWMRKTMKVDSWQQGVAFLPASISYLLGTNLFGRIATRIGRWRSALIGMLIQAVCLFTIPYVKSPGILVLPVAALGLAIGMVDSSIMPIMAELVDLRHTAVYGAVYAIADIAFCLSFALGPIISSTVISSIGFFHTLIIFGVIILVYAPLNIMLKNPPKLTETTAPTPDSNFVSYQGNPADLSNNDVDAIEKTSNYGY